MIKKLKKLILIYLNRGNRYYCPLCGYRAKALSFIGQSLPVIRKKQIIGSGLRRGGCFKCGSRDRERLVFTYLKEKLHLSDHPEYKVLHIAPEKRLSDFLLNLNFKHYHCGDIFTAGYHYPAHVKNMNVLSLPFKANYFDLIICNHVLEHVPEDLKAMREIFRVLKPGGQAILQVPISQNSKNTFENFSVTDPEKRKTIFGQFDHVRIYGQDYPSRLKAAGFKLKRLNLFRQYPSFGLNPDEDLFIGLK